MQVPGLRSHRHRSDRLERRAEDTAHLGCDDADLVSSCGSDFDGRPLSEVGDFDRSGRNTRRAGNGGRIFPELVDLGAVRVDDLEGAANQAMTRCADSRATCDATTLCWTPAKGRNQDAGSAPSTLNSPAGGIACAGSEHAALRHVEAVLARAALLGEAALADATASSAGAPAATASCWTSDRCECSGAGGAPASSPSASSAPSSAPSSGLNKFFNASSATSRSWHAELCVKIDGFDDGFRGHVEGVRRLY